MCWTGLPICVGIGHSKTLAKLANHHAKKQPAFHDVCDFTRMSPNQLDGVMKTLPVSSVWGIGRRLEASLKELGVENVLMSPGVNPWNWTTCDKEFKPPAWQVHTTALSVPYRLVASMHTGTTTWICPSTHKPV